MSKFEYNPFFIHSLHRSGSTYLFHAFRRAAHDGSPYYTCFQEPIHEISFYARNSPGILLTFEGSGSAQRSARHPQLEKPYFQELYDIHSAWKDVISPEIIYADYFGGTATSATSAYLKAIIEAAPKRPIIQECRTAMRMTLLKEQLGGSHVFLWRNSWDQWWSLKATDYFDTVHQLILNAPSHHRIISILKENIRFENCSKSSIYEQLSFYKTRRPSAEASYLTYFTIYMLSMIEAGQAADLLINIDQLSESSDYRSEILDNLKRFGIEGVDLSDCSVAQAPYDSGDAAFFDPLERRVLKWLEETGHDADRIAYIQRLREENAPSLEGRSRTKRFSVETRRLRDVLIRMENREAAALRDLNAKGAAQQSELVSLGQRTMEAERAKAELVNRLAAERKANEATSMAAREAERMHAQAERDRNALAKLIDIFDAERKSWQAELRSAIGRAEVIEAGDKALRDRLAISERNQQIWKQKCHEWWTIADRTSRELRDIHASRSWRMTRSYRQFGGLIRRRLDLHQSLAIQASPRATVRALALVLLSFARRHHWAKVSIRVLVSPFPALERRVLLFSLGHSPSPQAASRVIDEQAKVERVQAPRRGKKAFDSRVAEIISKIGK
ncbi:hypothetical protein DBIPINDM_000251 [Mesorhizobium sp. AR02]|uniref:hypothetical protein n=1 Tax=Mesorhizobium sp. AR02 TaxID=2865837 RepID=UPI0021607430|nr:hypothetical protein [Mesorhizobium sp. AR02]UVK53897.1 hypothetical protein DBIPINDM_000251 [Mesorhizobium sp. AR02]